MLASPPMAPSSAGSELGRLADLCVRCGLCLPHCPTYRLAREEGESPRGRIALAAALARDPALRRDNVLRRHLDHCLLCRACERVCPAEVPFARIMVHARTLLHPRRDRATVWRLAVFLLARPRLWRIALRLLRSAERLGLLPLLTRLRLRPPATVLPPLGSRWRPRRGGAGPWVYLFEGCVSSRLGSEAFHAAERILLTLGYRVRAARIPHCCGAALAHEGFPRAAARLAALLPRAYPGEAPVLVLDSGCLDAARQTLGGRARDIHDFLLANDLPRRARWKEGTAHAILHYPCTLRAEPAARLALERLLAAVPGLEWRRLPEQARCCGAGGLGFLDAAPEALRHRAELDEAPGEALLSANVGCRSWLAAGRLTHGEPGGVYHPLEFIAERIQR